MPKPSPILDPEIPSSEVVRKPFTASEKLRLLADRRLLAIEKENTVLKRKLQIAEGLIALQKKAHEILGIALPAFDEESS